MASQDSFTLLRTGVAALRLSPDAIDDDVVARILDLLGGRDQKAAQVGYTYRRRD